MEGYIDTNEELPEVIAYFQIVIVGETYIPTWVSEQEEGVIVPVRKEFPIEGPNYVSGKRLSSHEPGYLEDGVILYKTDLIQSLRESGKLQAARWWEDNLNDSGIELCAYRKQSGRLISKEMKKRFFPDAV